jgi:branched-chain amino acid transport system substrate-binding protein
MVAGLATTSSAAEYNILVLQSLTGPAAWIGVPFKDGMVMAAEEINRKQELGAGNSLKIVVADDATDRAQALPLITRYAADPNILMVMGPTSGAVAVPAANLANDLKMPLYTGSNQMDVIKAGPWSSILTPPPSATIPTIADYAARKLKVKNCSVIGISDNDSYVSLQRTFEAALKAQGVRIGSTDTIKITDSDFSAVATKVAGLDQDCVFVSAPPEQAANIIIQLRQAGLDPKVRIIGHNSIASPQFVKRGGSAVEGVVTMGAWVPGGSDATGRDFVAAFKARYNSDPDEFAAIGYSGMRVAAQAIKSAGPNPTRDSVRLALAKVRDVRVVIGKGTYSMGEDRAPVYAINVLMVQGGRFISAP